MQLLQAENKQLAYLAFLAKYLANHLNHVNLLVRPQLIQVAGGAERQASIAEGARSPAAAWSRGTWSQLLAPAKMSPSGGPCCRQGAGGGGGSGAGAGGWRRGSGAPIGLPTGGSGSESTNGFTPWSLHARESAASSASGQGARQSAHAAGRARARDRARHARWYWWWHTGHKVRRRRSAPFVEIGSKQTGHTDGETGGDGQA